MDVNSGILVGRLARDPELRESQNGQDHDWCGFPLAVNRQGSKDADYPFITCFGKLARAVAGNCETGKEVSVEYSVRTSTIEKEGKKETRTSLIAHRVSFGQSSKKKQQAAGATTVEDVMQALVSKGILSPEVLSAEAADADDDSTPFDNEM